MVAFREPSTRIGGHSIDGRWRGWAAKRELDLIRDAALVPLSSTGAVLRWHSTHSARPQSCHSSTMRNVLLLLLPALAFALRRPQTVVCRDARTQREVTLVGCMHYNPASIALAADCVREAPALGAVVVESCESRWRKTQQTSPVGSFSRRYLLPSEMLAAADVAAERGLPVSLGDVDVKEFTPRLRELFAESLRDLLSPPDGWRRIFDDLKRGAGLAFDVSDLGGEALGFEDFLRPGLLLGLAGSFLRYPAAAAVKAPAPFFALATLLTVGGSTLEAAATNADALAAAGESSPELYALSAVLFAMDVVLPIVFSRLLLVAFLEERNVRLARSITEAAARERGDVVAILGALHVNGVAKLLKSGEALEPGKAGTWWTEDMIEEPSN